MSLVLVAACSSELDPTEPEDAYAIFVSALIEGDGDTVWERSDEQTRDYFEERYQTLVEMDQMINRYLPQTDVALAREQSGAILLDDVEGGRDLFMKVYAAQGLTADQAVQVGAAVDEVEVAEDGMAARVITRAGQKYLLQREADEGPWYVMLISSGESVQSSFGWLEQNEKALKQTVEDLIREERQKREQMISELMDFKAKD